VGLQLIRVYLDPGLGEHDPAVHDQAALDPPDPHSDQLPDADMGTGEQGAEPETEEFQEYGDKGDRCNCNQNVKDDHVILLAAQRRGFPLLSLL
jgi:hypothetical protein